MSCVILRNVSVKIFSHPVWKYYCGMHSFWIGVKLSVRGIQAFSSLVICVTYTRIHTHSIPERTRTHTHPQTTHTHFTSMLELMFRYNCKFDTLSYHAGSHSFTKYSKSVFLDFSGCAYCLSAVDSWFLAPLNSLCIGEGKHYIKKLFAAENGLHCDCIEMNVWSYGKRKSVTLQTSLPTINGKLYYLRSSVKNVFWSALVRKMYFRISSACIESMYSDITLMDIWYGPRHFLARRLGGNVNSINYSPNLHNKWRIYISVKTSVTHWVKLLYQGQSNETINGHEQHVLVI